jgi:hypothetical protein
MSALSFFQDNYETAKISLVAGLAYAQEYTTPLITAAQAKITEYNVKEIFHSCTSVSHFGECVSTYLNTPVKQVLAIQIVLNALFVILILISKFFAG